MYGVHQLPLHPNTIRAINRWWERGESVVTIRRAFGVCYATILRHTPSRRKEWKRLTPELEIEILQGLQAGWRKRDFETRLHIKYRDFVHSVAQKHNIALPKRGRPRANRT